jgi:NTE family protein
MRHLIVLISLTLGHYSTSAQYKNLVFEGGGVRGIAYTGALQILDSAKILSGIERVGGTSVGAIQAALISIGYSPAETAQLLSSVPFKEFNDGSLWRAYSKLKRRFGIYKGEKLSNWLGELIEKKTGNGSLTFQQLHDLRTSKSYKDLYVTGTDISYRRLRIFSHETYPHMSIRDAVRISASIPFYFEPVAIDSVGNILKRPFDSTINYHLMLDGGVLENYPIAMFDTPQFLHDNNRTPKGRNKETLGIMLEKPSQINYKKDEDKTFYRVGSLRDFFNAVYLTSFDKPNPDESDLQRTIVINDDNIKGRIRKMPEADVKMLVENGKNAVRSFLLKH